MGSITGFEFVFLVLLALLVLGPEKLPKFAADTGRLVRNLRRMATDARAEVRESLGPELRDAYGELRDLGDLDPRTMARTHLLDGEDDFGVGDEMPPAAANGSRNGSGSTGAHRMRAEDSPDSDDLDRGGPAQRASGSGSTAAAERPPYDADAT